MWRHTGINLCPHQFSINTSLIAHLYKLVSLSLQAVTYLLCSSVYTASRGNVSVPIPMNMKKNCKQVQNRWCQVLMTEQHLILSSSDISCKEVKTKQNITLIYQDNWIQKQHELSFTEI